jgi:large subunit ribosomal protein L21
MLDVASIDAAPGSSVELRDVLLVSDGDSVTVGSPIVANALVLAEVVQHGKGKKVINFKFKAKTRYRRKRGHRQAYTRLMVNEIRFGETSSKREVHQPAAVAKTPVAEAPAAPARRARAAAAPTAEAPVAESKPAPRRRAAAKPAAEAKAAPAARPRRVAKPKATKE